MTAIKLVVILCLGSNHCAHPRPIEFASWQACAEAGASMVAHSRRVGTGMVGFECLGMGGGR